MQYIAYTNNEIRMMARKDLINALCEYKQNPS